MWDFRVERVPDLTDFQYKLHFPFHLKIANRVIDILIAIFTGFLVSLCAYFVGELHSRLKRRKLGKQYLPISQLKRNLDRVILVIDFVSIMSTTTPSLEKSHSKLSNDEVTDLIRKWRLDGSVPELTGMKNLLFNAELRHTNTDPTFADGFCNEIADLIRATDAFVLSPTFSYLNLGEQSIFFDFLGTDFVVLLKRELGGDTGLKGADDPAYMLTSDRYRFGELISTLFLVVSVINKYVGKSEKIKLSEI